MGLLIQIIGTAITVIIQIMGYIDIETSIPVIIALMFFSLYTNEKSYAENILKLHEEYIKENEKFILEVKNEIKD